MTLKHVHTAVPDEVIQSAFWNDNHVGTATVNKMLKGDASGLPTDATNTDAEVAAAVTASHTQNTDVSLKSNATTGVMQITGPAAGTTRVKTIRDANDTILELGGSYTPTGTWTSLKLNENVALTSTSTKLNYLTAATGTTGTNSTNIVFSTSPVLTTPNLGTPSAGTLTNCSGLPAANVVAGIFVAGMEASDHGAAATDQIINVCYGTGDPPAANTTTEGALFIKYTA